MTLEQLIQKLEIACAKTPDKPVYIKAGSEMQGFLTIQTFQFSPPPGASDDRPYITALLPKYHPITTVNCLKIAIETVLEKHSEQIGKFKSMDVMLHHTYANDGSLGSPKVVPIDDVTGEETFCFRIVA